VRHPFAILRATVTLLALALVASAVSTRGAVERPTYAIGDRWVYDLEGDLAGLPGLDQLGLGAFTLTVVGRVEVEVVGLPLVDGTIHVDVVSVTTGFLNATFDIPGTIFTASVTGSLSAEATERWEPEGYLPIASNSTTTYIGDVAAVIFTTRFVAEIRVNSSSTIVFQAPVFPLDVGNISTAVFSTDLVANTTVTVVGETMSSENATSFASAWRREVLARGNVSVAAGTFDGYWMNQTLSFFPGFGVVAVGENGNETAHYSNDARNYVRRTAYVNGTELGEMRLRSYARAAPGLSLVDILLIAAIPSAVAVALVAWLSTKRRRKQAGGEPRAR